MNKRQQIEGTEQVSEYYIEASTSLVERSLRTIKAGELFGVFDGRGDCGLVPESPEGLFCPSSDKLRQMAA